MAPTETPTQLGLFEGGLIAVALGMLLLVSQSKVVIENAVWNVVQLGSRSLFHTFFLFISSPSNPKFNGATAMGPHVAPSKLPPGQRRHKMHCSLGMRRSWLRLEGFPPPQSIFRWMKRDMSTCA